MIDAMLPTDTITNVTQLQRHLITRVANGMVNYYLQLMRPSVTQAAALWARARVSQSFEAMYDFALSPAPRAALARHQLFLREAFGGVGAVDFPKVAGACYAARAL